MKWLFLLAILAVVVIFVATRYRRHIQSGIFLVKMLRRMRAAGAPPKQREITPAAASGDVELVRCAGCGSWTPRATSLRLSKGNFYCQSSCIEKSVRT